MSLLFKSFECIVKENVFFGKTIWIFSISFIVFEINFFWLTGRKLEKIDVLLFLKIAFFSTKFKLTHQFNISFLEYLTTSGIVNTAFPSVKLTSQWSAIWDPEQITQVFIFLERSAKGILQDTKKMNKQNSNLTVRKAPLVWSLHSSHQVEDLKVETWDLFCWKTGYSTRRTFWKYKYLKLESFNKESLWP